MPRWGFRLLGGHRFAEMQRPTTGRCLSAALRLGVPTSLFFESLDERWRYKRTATLFDPLQPPGVLRVGTAPRGSLSLSKGFSCMRTLLRRCWFLGGLSLHGLGFRGRGNRLWQRLPQINPVHCAFSSGVRLGLVGLDTESCSAQIMDEVRLSPR